MSSSNCDSGVKLAESLNGTTSILDYKSTTFTRGYYKRWGQCHTDYDSAPPRPTNFDPFVACADNSTCLAIDTNLVCNTNLTIQTGGKCECRQNMRWNTK